MFKKQPSESQRQLNPCPDSKCKELNPVSGLWIWYLFKQGRWKRLRQTADAAAPFGAERCCSKTDCAVLDSAKSLRDSR